MLNWMFANTEVKTADSVSPAVFCENQTRGTPPQGLGYVADRNLLNAIRHTLNVLGLMVRAE